MPDVIIRAQDGPQRMFARCDADIAFYGGAAGSGKSFALIMEAARGSQVKGFTGIMFRRTAPEIIGGGGLWDESSKMYPMLGGKSNDNSLTWRFDSGARVQFSHLQREKDKFAHQGRQYAFEGWDEISHFTESQFWYLTSRNRSTCGMRPWIRATTNPVPSSNKTGGWVRRMIDWWIGKDGYPIKERSGVVRWFIRVGDDLVWTNTKNELEDRHAEDAPMPMSFTFISAKLGDNKVLTDKDPMYRARLLALPRVERERLLEGNWDVESAPGMYFRRSFFEVIDQAPTTVSARVRAWDKAVTTPTPDNPDPDFTAGALYSRLPDGSFCIEHMERFRSSTFGVETSIHNTAVTDGKGTTVALWQDPGQAGKSDAQHFVRGLSAFRTRTEVAGQNKETYAGPWSSQAEAGNIKIVRGSWNDAFLTEAGAFPSSDSHDDQIDAVSLAHIVIGDNTDLERLRSLAKWR